MILTSDEWEEAVLRGIRSLEDMYEAQAIAEARGEVIGG